MNCPHIRDSIRKDLGGATANDARAAARILRKLAAAKEPGGKLRPLYLQVADLCDYDADSINAGPCSTRTGF